MDMSMIMRADSVMDTVENERFITRRTNTLKDIANGFMNKAMEYTEEQNTLTTRLNATVLDPTSEDSITDYMELLQDLKDAMHAVRSYTQCINGTLDEINRIMDNRDVLIKNTVNGSRKPETECKYRLSNGRRCRRAVAEGTVYCRIHVDAWCEKCRTNHAIGEYHNGYIDKSMCKSCHDDWKK